MNFRFSDHTYIDTNNLETHPTFLLETDWDFVDSQ